jgi:hypothetical protein
MFFILGPSLNKFFKIGPGGVAILGLNPARVFAFKENLARLLCKLT